MEREQTEKIVDLAASLAAKADDLDQVLIIYRYKQKETDDSTHGSMDNDLEIRDALYLAQNFIFWLQAAAS